MAPSRPAPASSLPVYDTKDFACAYGANMGDPLSFAAELILDDIYTFAQDTAPRRLDLISLDAIRSRIDAASNMGQPGHAVHLDCALSFMSPDGITHDAILLVEVDAEGDAAHIFLLPLTALSAKTEYRLVGVDTDTAAQKFAQAGCVSFTRGTHITLSSGEQRLIEDLNIGDRVLTRDDSVQKIRWIGQSTVRAMGEFAPIKIHAGTLNNEHDLVVSPDHRLFIYQRSDEVGAGRAELLVKARHLVNGYTVTQMEGGFVDYFQLLFDSHQIIYAEGIAAETMLITSRTKPVLPDEVTADMGDVIPGHSDVPHAGLDVNEGLLDRPDAVEMLRKASTR